MQTLDKDGEIGDSGDFASTSGYDHKEVVGSIKSLQSYEMIISKARVLFPGCALCKVVKSVTV